MIAITSSPLVAPVRRSLVGILASLCFINACSSENHPSQMKEHWDERNDPGLFALHVMKLSDIPEEGQLPDEKFPWTDDYWATYAGGISKRWQERHWGTNYEDYLYQPLDGEAFLSNPNAVDIAKLSPAEKFDLYQNRYDFPLTRFEQQRTLRSVNPETNSIPTWVGLCHGWAPASLMEPEPGRIATVTNERGLEIPFYTSDIAALMIHVYANAGGAGRFLGRRCNIEEHAIEYDGNGRVMQRECRDVNPGSLHLALGQLLGASDPSKREGFILDLFFTDQVWNHPVVGYKVKSIDVKAFNPDDDPLAPHRAEGTRQLARVKVDIFYAAGAQPHMQPMLDRRESYTSSQRFEYTLELDQEGNIIGGEWEGQKRPDFMWALTTKPLGTDLLPHEKVAELLALSRHEEAPPEETDEAPPPAEEAPESPADSASSTAALPPEPIDARELALPNAPVPRF